MGVPRALKDPPTPTHPLAVVGVVVVVVAAHHHAPEAAAPPCATLHNEASAAPPSPKGRAGPFPREGGWRGVRRARLREVGRRPRARGGERRQRRRRQQDEHGVGLPAIMAWGLLSRRQRRRDTQTASESCRATWLKTCIFPSGFVREHFFAR